jgi:hypothetical protein
MLRALSGLLGAVFLFFALAVPTLGIWALYEESALDITYRSSHWLLARIVYVIFLLAFGLFCAFLSYGLLRYMYSGRQKAKLPPNHRLS